MKTIKEKTNNYPSAQQFKEFFNSIFAKLPKKKDDIELIFGDASEADDPVNGMHEFSYEIFPTTVDPQCIHCGKRKSELANDVFKEDKKANK